MTKNNFLVIITSVIYFKNRRLSYSKIRSDFSPEERLLQTKKTIESIRKKIPTAEIILLEYGLKDVGNLGIISLVDSYKYLGDNFFVRIGANSPFKGLGEAIGLFVGSFYFKKDFSRFFKISGRYYLNQNFNLQKWLMGDFIVKNYNRSISTRFYSFSRDVFYRWRLYLLLSIPILFLNRSIENILYWFIPSRIKKGLSVIGVSGYVGTDRLSKIEE